MTHDNPRTENEPVWTYRGYQLQGGNFTTAMVHLFRGEITRANLWRERLDATTNWAVVTTAAVITFVFGSAQPDVHSLLILNVLLVTLFLFIEARRYRYYELWSSRVRLMETDFYGAMLVPPFQPADDWAETLAETLLHPQFPVSMWEALGRRYRRNYVWLFLGLSLVWVLKIWLHPETATSMAGFFQRAAIGSIPGEAVLAAGVVYNGIFLALGLATRHLHDASGEVLPRYSQDVNWRRLSNDSQPWFVRRRRKRQQILSWIVTMQPDVLAEQIMSEMSRGVTHIQGTGMYTGDERSLLMCAITVTEVQHLKSLVSTHDPEGFVIIMPAMEILGGQFSTMTE